MNSTTNLNTVDISRLQEYPKVLIEAINKIVQELDLQVFLVGGVVRDILSSQAQFRDLDLAVPNKGIEFAQRLARILKGTFVLLDEEEGVARVVWRGYDIDLSDFKDGVKTIEEDLLKRDFTINAMAVQFPPSRPTGKKVPFLDPSGGKDDLKEGIVRSVSKKTFSDDPLRLLRAYRFLATLGFHLHRTTERDVKDKSDLIKKISPERISYELDLIMSSERSCYTLKKIREAGLLKYIIPEVERGAGVVQPAGHHLDVLEHNMAALCAMEDILKRPGKYFREVEVMEKFLERPAIKIRLKWAAFFHDLGKPGVMRVKEKKITFYNHDHYGADLVKEIGIRLRWSKDKYNQISRLVGYHMWPFHLSNVRRREGVTIKACLRLVKKVGDELPGLFLLSMADSLASQGPGRPVSMERDLAELFSEVHNIVDKQISPSLSSPRLVTGQDLIDYGLKPGPVFKEILGRAEESQATGKIKNREEALDWLKNHIELHYSELVE